MVEQMRVLEFHGENYKGLRVVDITTADNEPVVQITGQNGAGKSSVIDGMWDAIGGGKASKTKEPIRRGENHAEVTVTFGDFEATRTWDRKGADSDEFETKLVLRQRAAEANADGDRPYYHVPRPQEMLDRFWSSLTFDLSEFMDRMSAKQQQAALVQIVKLPFDPVQLDAERLEKFNLRTDVGRTVKALEGQLAGYGKPDPDLPAAPLSASELFAAKQAHDAQVLEGIRLEREVNNWATRVADLSAQLETASAAALVATGRLAAYTPPTEGYGAELAEQLASIDETNAKIRAAEERSAVAKKLDAARDQQDTLTKTINALDAKRAEGLAGASFPVPGLGFDDSGITVDGIPFAQVNRAAQLKVAMGIGVAARPELPIVRFSEGSMLDETSRAQLRELAIEYNAQVWLEVVGTEGGIVIEEGRVKA